VSERGSPEPVRPEERRPDRRKAAQPEREATAAVRPEVSTVRKTGEPDRVDSHHHLWDLGRGYPWLDDPALAGIRRSFGVADLRAVLAPAGVDRTVLVEAGRCDAAEVGEFLALAANTPEIAGVVGWAELTDPRLPATLAEYRLCPGGDLLVGVRAQVQGEADPGYLRRPDVQRGLSTVAEAGLAYDLVVRADQLPGAAAAAAAVPHGRFVLDHLGKPPIKAGELAGWRASLAGLAARPNACAKLSGLVTEADWARWTPADLRPYVLTAVELFGPGRLMFGSDWPVCLLAASYRQVVDALAEAIADLSAAERAGIWGGNAARWYRLDVSPS
jgi:L-fuconolactonase